MVAEYSGRGSERLRLALMVPIENLRQIAHKMLPPCWIKRPNDHHRGNENQDERYKNKQENHHLFSAQCQHAGYSFRSQRVEPASTLTSFLCWQVYLLMKAHAEFFSQICGCGCLEFTRRGNFDAELTIEMRKCVGSDYHRKKLRRGC